MQVMTPVVLAVCLLAVPSLAAAGGACCDKDHGCAAGLAGTLSHTRTLPRSTRRAILAGGVFYIQLKMMADSPMMQMMMSRGAGK